MPDLLVEIRCEELPARRVRAAATALRDGIFLGLARASLLPEEVVLAGATLRTAEVVASGGFPESVPALGTPRRLASFVPSVLPRQPDRAERAWGPPVSAAFAPDGKPTKAGEGFSRTVGVALDAMQRGEKQAGKPPYLYVDRTIAGAAASELIPGILREALRALPFRKSMRWPGSDLPFARPVRGLVVLLGSDVVPCALFGVESGRETRGHAFLAPAPIALASADPRAYVTALREARVLVDVRERGSRIEDLVVATRRAAGGDGGWTVDELDLREEVAGLVEWPAALAGSFDERYAALPAPVLVTSMAHHLRFFPVRGADGGLLPRFVSVTDRDDASSDSIRAGNERVLRARLYDAKFFFDNDRKRRLEEFRPALAGVDFHRGLGTLLDRSEHVRSACAALAETLDLDGDARRDADRAAFLLKCDLVTEVVKEFPEIQGVVGAEYAALDGEAESVVRALGAQYPPAHEAPDVIADDAAALVVLADKADALAAYFSIGEEPTGSADPFGLRRHAIALLDILERTRWPLSIESVLAPSRAARRAPDEAAGRLHAFLWARAEQRARDDGFVDFLDCVGARTDLPYHEVGDRLRALRALSRTAGWPALVALVERCGNMGVAAGEGGLSIPAQGRAIVNALGSVREWVRSPEGASGEAWTEPSGSSTADVVRHADIEFADRYAAALSDPVAALFDSVLVDDPAEPARSAALKALLHGVFRLFADRLGDLRRLGSGARPPRG